MKKVVLIVLIVLIVFIFLISLVSSALTDNLVSYYKYDESSGDVVDSHGANNGTNFGADRGENGILGNAFKFITANSDYVNLHNFGIDIDNLSISMWINSSNYDQYAILIGENPVNQRWLFFLNADFAGTLVFRGGSIGSDLTCTLGNLTANSWNHVVFTVSGTSAKIYANNVVCASGSINAVVHSTGNITSGKYENNYYYGDLMDELGIWNTTLTSSQVSDLYNSGNAFAYPFVTDFCTYTSGDWIIDCADNCTISADVVGDGSDLICSGVGSFDIEANISGFSDYKFIGACTAKCTSAAGCIKI